MRALAFAALLAIAVPGCGSHDKRQAVRLPATAPSVGRHAGFRPPSLGASATNGEPIAGLRCTRRSGARYVAHLELFAARRVVLVAPGIGIAPPRQSKGAYVRSGRCSYPLRTREPTGVIEVRTNGRPKTLGQLFAIWGQPLGREKMAGFGGRVSAYVNGRAWREDPRAIRLQKHAQIVLEVGGYVRPHATYGFPPGL